MADILDIEDLSLLLHVARETGRPPRPVPRSFSAEDLSIRVIVEAVEDDEPELTATIVDTLTNEESAVYRFKEGLYLRYRIGVLGIGQAVDEVYDLLRLRLEGATDPVAEDVNLWARYQVALFGGAESGVAPADAELLADRLALFKPNYLVLVNAGHVKNKFADKTPQQLAMITHHINEGAQSAGQRPYAVVLVTDKPIPLESYTRYCRLCQAMNTFPAEAQFAPDSTEELVGHVVLKLRAYTRGHMELRRTG
jgi:hypothetical protein